MPFPFLEDILSQFQTLNAAVTASPLSASVFFWFKTTMIAFSLAFFGGLVYIIIRMNRTLRQSLQDIGSGITIEPDEASVPKSLFEKQWSGFLERLSENRPSEWKIVVIEADKMLEDALKKAGFAGETIGDTLRRIDRSKLVSLDRAWEGHRLRNTIVHDPNRAITAYEARTALENFGAALRELGMID